MLRTKQEAKIMPLSKLLHGIEKANKRDSWDYTGGHLNHNHLFKPQVLKKTVYWNPGKKSQHWHLNNVDKLIVSNGSDKMVKMRNDLSKFSHKTSLLPDDYKNRSLCELSLVTKQTEPATPLNTPLVSLVLETQSPQIGLHHQDPHHRAPSQMEELGLPELKLPFNCDRKKTSLVYSENCQLEPVYFTGLTKFDQYNLFLQFDKKILQKQYTRNTFVECYEKNLTKRLHNIAHIKPPHFAHLESFNATFENIANGSAVFGNILKQIKNAYELYIDYLFDTQSSIQHKVLMSEIVCMKKRPVKTEDVDLAVQTVRKLEQKAQIALQHNDQLRTNLKSKLANISNSDTDTNEELLLKSLEEKTSKEPYFPSEMDYFVSKRNEVLAAWLDVSTLEQEISKNMTHALNAETTEQYIKDIKAETVKLQSSNSFLKRANKDLDTEMKRLLMKQKLTLDKQEEIKKSMDSFFQREEI